MDPENCEKNDEQGAREEGPPLNSDVNQTDTRPDKSMEITTERIRDAVSDPNYPSYEILLDVAGKLLDSFEKE